MTAQENNLYSLVPLDEFKAILGIDDRDDKIARFCLVTSTFTIEQYCKRRLLRKKHFERIEYMGDLVLPLREYPVSGVLAVYTLSGTGGTGEIVEPEFYHVIPDCGSNEDFPFSVELSPAFARMGCKAIKVIYFAGYNKGAVPTELAAACLELASWNMNRYRGRRVGMTGNIRGAGKEGEHFEMSMPENVKALLEPYRRKTI
ncbi:MAG: hypothetical protein LBI03_05745 [Clostridiales bacterium]|jgi:hypothetical protein|nr:hypothetical protein [Clostridiales bacterium]